MERCPHRHLSLFEAMCEFGQQELVAAMLALLGKGYDAPIRILSSGPMSEDERLKGRYRDLRGQLEEGLLRQLRDGTLVASGYDSATGLSVPAASILADHWRVLKPDFENSTARFGEREIIGILVAPNGDGASAPPTPDPAAPAVSATKRLLINHTNTEVVLDGTTRSLLPQAFKLLVLLADALIAGSGPLSTAQIHEKLFPASPDRTAVSGVISEIRKALDGSVGPSNIRKSVLKNRNRVGYFLDLPRGDVTILP
jgi:hypothetical protein